MITLPGIGIHGRLGNQLFQVAAMKALSLRLNIPCYLPSDLEEREQYGQKSLLNNFLHNIPFLDKDEYMNSGAPKFQQNDWDKDIDTDFFDLSGATQLIGFFESELYFKNYREEIKSIFTLKDEIMDYAKNYLDELKKSHGKPIVAIHLRLGDYVTLGMNPMKRFQFVEKVIQGYFSDKDYTFLVFTGGSIHGTNSSNNEDIEFCENTILADKKYIPCRINDTIREFAIMSLCENIILTTKSTMGWWAAYLNKNPNKKVYVPMHNSTEKLKFNPDILWPNEFIKIEDFHP